MSPTPTLDSLRTQWVDAFNSHDLDTHVGLYTPDAMLFGSHDEMYRGQEGVRRYFGGQPALASVRSYPAPVVVQISEDVAVTAGYIDFADGEMLLPYRLTWTVVRLDGNWRIAQHHGAPRPR